jgi:hypothetical protein
MQKALMQMNVQLHHVVSDITRATEMRIIGAILDGERDAAVLAQARDVRCKSSKETIQAALEGNYRAEHLFALRQALECYELHRRKVEECDAQIEGTLEALNENLQPPDAPTTS